eukprot:TRINITY_DN12574_c0_g1_i2.p1 TRINITY_DN12574_c0_g1~~TRINITY_DN12574_c0_g1_i2.p1  ORF type:complete len:112 (+),score=2.59 TRINITY_DN12574_c0_g1_i2:207-542(+)
MVSLGDAESYKGNMETLIRDLRFNHQLPTLLIIQVSCIRRRVFYRECEEALSSAINLGRRHGIATQWRWPTSQDRSSGQAHKDVGCRSFANLCISFCCLKNWKLISMISNN